ncbi:hypothetical protein TR2A62_3579 [Thalassobium sp. R2A62]|nr:hypothetical protein TR2A62_3579 [Thalassobium sp. R2A62]
MAERSTAALPVSSRFLLTTPFQLFRAYGPISGDLMCV